MNSGSREFVALRHTGRWLIATVVLLCAGAALHTFFMLMNCPLDLSGDEAHDWE
jgi:hypothetical protein